MAVPIDTSVLVKGQVIRSVYSDNEYLLAERVGEGGFGVTYRAILLDSDCAETNVSVCLKFMKDKLSWIREAYFGSLLASKKSAVQLFDSFPFEITMGSTAAPYYVLVFEWMQNGSLSGHLRDSGPWPEKRARREIVALLGLLAELHAASAVHRDLTPMNVLVNGDGHLRLSDFGIAGHGVGSSFVAANAFNPAFVSCAKRGRRRRYWLYADDVYQMGQIIGMLMAGNGERRLVSKNVDKLNCSDELKEIILRAIGPRSDRYDSAQSMMAALDRGSAVVPGEVRSLKGLKVVFTGPMSVSRSRAKILLSQAGGEWQDKVHPNTDVVVVGGRSKLYKARVVGSKLQDLEKMNRKGAGIRTISDAQFMRLVE